MSVVGAILLVLAGLAIMAFGIFFFYAWVRFLYGLFGLEIGLLFGRSLTGDVGLLAIILGIVGAVLLFGAAYFLEPYRRLLLGLSAGARLGFRSRRSSDWIISSVASSASFWRWLVPYLARSSSRGTSTHLSLSHPRSAARP